MSRCRSSCKGSGIKFDGSRWPAPGWTACRSEGAEGGSQDREHAALRFMGEWHEEAVIQDASGLPRGASSGIPCS